MSDRPTSDPRQVSVLSISHEGPRFTRWIRLVGTDAGDYWIEVHAERTVLEPTEVTQEDGMTECELKVVPVHLPELYVARAANAKEVPALLFDHCQIASKLLDTLRREYEIWVRKYHPDALKEANP